MKIFISGTTKDFERERRKLRDICDGFTQLELTPIVQETLTEDGAPDANIVRKIIEGVRRCDLFLGLVGCAGGFPQPLDERRIVQQLAERFLREQLGGLAPSGLWRGWGDSGMTYTQLEVFLATSVFGKRTRLYHPWPLDGLDFDEHQRPYFDFLWQNKHVLDLVSLDEWKVDALRLVVEYELQRRSVTEPIPAHVPAREALRQRFGLVLDEYRRACLKSSSFDAFYAEVLRRFSQLVPVLEKRSPPEPLAPRRVVGRPALVVQQDDGFSAAIRCASHVMTVRYDSRSGMVRTKRSFDVDQAAYPLSMTPDGEALLVMRGQEACLLLGAEQPQAVDVPELDVFSRLPALLEHEGRYGLAIQQTDGATEWRWLNPDDMSPGPLNAGVRHPDLLYFEPGAVEVVGQGEPVPLTLPISQPTLLLHSGLALLLHAEDVSLSVESVELREYRAAPVIELFRVAETAVEAGHFVQMKVDSVDDSLVWIVEYNRAEGEQAEARIELGMKIGAGPAPEVVKPKGVVVRANDPIESPFPQAPRPIAPFSAKYSWTTNGEFLLAVASGTDGGFVAHAWRFPRPVEGGDFVQGVWDILRGQRPYDREGASAWRAILKNQRSAATT